MIGKRSRKAAQLRQTKAFPRGTAQAYGTRLGEDAMMLTFNRIARSKLVLLFAVG
jgi:hypothetical protein